MGNEKRAEQKYNHFVRKKLKRIIAVTLSLLMVTSVIDYSGFIVNAEVTSDTRTITAIEELAENISSQQIAAGESETDINLPDTMNVTVKTYVQDNAQTSGNNTDVTPDEKAKEVADNNIQENEVQNNEVTQQETTENVTSESTENNVAASTQSMETATQEKEESITLEDIKWNINATESASDTFDSSVEGTIFVYEPVLPEGYTLAEGVSLPQIQVQIKTNEDSTVSTEAGTLKVTEEQILANEVGALTATAEDGEASVTDSEGAVTYYDTIENAITAAQSMSGSTVTLLKDVQTESFFTVSSGTFSIDLNGNTWHCTYIYGMALNLEGSADSLVSVTFKDGAGGGNFTTDGTYSVYKQGYATAVFEGGNYTGIFCFGNVGDLLADGYAYKNNESGEWVTDVSGNTISNVTVAQAPIEMMSVSVTEADGTVHNYVTIKKAITAAQSMSGSTLKLLKDVETSYSVYLTSGILTIDLHGQTWTCMSGYVIIKDGANVTFMDSGSNGKITGADNFTVLIGTNGTLTLKGGTFTGGNVASIYNMTGDVADLLADGYAYQNSDSGAIITDMSGDEISNITVRAIPVKITAQPEDAVAAPGYSEAPTFNVTAETIPTDSGNEITYQWYKNSAAMSGATSASYTAETGLADATYTYYCAVTCDGYTVNSDNATLYVTSAEGNYEVTSSGGLTFKYPTLETAITAAKSKPNSTVKLLADATTADTVEVSSGTFTIDLNGHTWTAAKTALLLKSGSNVTLKDSAANGILQSPAYGVIVVDASSYTVPVTLNIESGSYKCQNTGMGNVIYSSNDLDIPNNIAQINISGGEFSLDKPVSSWVAYFTNATVNISGGKFSGSNYFSKVNAQLSGGEFGVIANDNGSVATLLKAGYGFRTIDSRSGAADNQWVNQIEGAASHVNDLAHTSLTYMTRVEKLPLEIKNQPVNPANAVYGYTSAPQASMFAEKTDAAPEGSTITYQWYRVKSGDETSDTAVGTSATQTLPTGLDAGTHSFYCVVTCDGYILNSESATFTVEKATPTVALQVFTKNSDPFEYGKEVFFTAVVTGVDDETPDGTVTFKIGSGTIDTADYDNSSKNYTLSNGQFFDAGTYSFTAIYTPSADGTGKNYVGVTSAAVEKTIDKATPNITLEIKGVGADDEIVYGSAVTYTVRVTGVDGVALTDATIVNANCVDGGNPVGYVMEYNMEKGAYFISQANFNNARPGTYPFYAIAVFPEGSDTDNNYVLGEDNEIISASISKTVQKADTSVAFQTSYSGNYYYTGSPVSNPAAADLIITGASYSNVTFAWYDSSSNQMDTPPTAPGSYTLAVSIPENDYFKPSSNTKSVTISSYNGTVTPSYNGSTTKAGWYTGDVQISADGYTVSDSEDGTFASSYLLSGEGEVSKTLYFKQDGTGYITDGKSVSVSIDKTAPAFSADTDGITISDNNWKGFLNNITFGHFFKENKDVSISATDSGSGVSKYYYYIDTTGSTTLKTAEELNDLSFTEGSSFSISSESKYIIYAYAVDAAGNKSAYICTDGIVIDKTAPTVTLTAPTGSDLEDVSGAAKVKMNETGIISYVIKTTEQSGITAQNILDSTEKNTVSVTDGQMNTELDLPISGLTASTTYYLYAVGTDSAENNGEVKSASFTTTKTQPTFTVNPTITGTYGQQVKDMTVSQVTSTNGVTGSWSVSSTDKPSVGTSATYAMVFMPDNTEQYATVTRNIVPTVQPKSLTAEGVAIGEVSGTYTYDGTEKKPVVTVSNSAATITASDYDYSYSNNTDAGTATVTITAKGNYAGIVSRTFTIAKALAPTITFPTAGSLTYGQKVSASVLTGGSIQFGTFAWTNGNTVPTVANSGYEVTFTPSADTLRNYAAIAKTSDIVEISMSKATPAVIVNVAISGDVGNRRAALTVNVASAGDGKAPEGTIKFVNTTSGNDADIEGATDITIVDGKATFTWTGLASQIYKVKAVYSGDDNYNTVTSGELEFDTTKKNQAALSVGSIGTKTYGDSSFALSTTGGSGSGAVTFESSDPSIVSVSGTTTTIHKAGTVTITATKAMTDDYNQATAAMSLTIGKKALTVKADEKLNISLGSAMPQLTYTVNGLVGKDTFTNPTISATAADTQTVGEYGILISGGMLTNADSYMVSYTNGIFQITVSKGVTYTVSNMKYKVTDEKTDGTGTVTLTGSTKSKSGLKGTLKIGHTVKIGGKSFKITAIGDKAFKGYSKLTKVTIGNNVTTIGKEAFSRCSKVTSVTIGTGLKTMSSKAFYNCKKLKTITISSKQLKTVGKDAIKKIYGNAVIKVPSSKVKAYKKLYKSSTGFTNEMQLKKK